jgi:hypothetical protein
MKLGFVAAPLLFAATAYAQAPGDYAEDEVAPPGMTPVAVMPDAAPVAVRPLRWSVGFGVGSVDLAPHHQPESQTEFAIGQLAIRYRATAHLEIELALSGGAEQLEDGEKGDREMSQGVLAVRYRFQPHRPWNWWVMAGMGTLAVTSQYASDDERDEAQQSTLQFGLGIERRFRRFAFQFEGRAVGVAPNDEDMTAPAYPDDVKPQPGGAGGGSTGSEMTPPPDKLPFYPASTRDGLKGGQLTLGVSYYF